MTENEAGHRKKKTHGSNQRQRTKTAMVRMTPDESAAITERAQNAGLSTAAYLRACALGDSGPRAKRSPPINRALLSEALADLNRVGNNLNQIAKQLNSGGYPDHAAMAEARAELMGLIEAIMGALGRGS